MRHEEGRASSVEAEMSLGLGQVKIVRSTWTGPIDVQATASTHHLQLALLPVSNAAMGCFPERWGPHRFAPIGEMFLLPARHTLHAKSECHHQSSVVCSFDPAAIASWFADDIEWTDARLCGSLNINNANVRKLLSRIGDEMRAPGFGGKAMVELLTGQTIIEVFRHLWDIEENKTSGGLAPWRLRLIDERLATDSASTTLAELAELCALSVRHLTRGFRVSRGVSIGSYIAEYRMTHARRLLASGMCVKSVAQEVGFSAASNFAAAFLRATGETPRQYRDRAHHVVAIAQAGQSQIH